MTAPGHLFVYGTLPSDAGGAAHGRWMRGVRRVGPATVQGRLHDAEAHPAAVPSDDPADRIRGELYEIDPASADTLLAALDRYEGHDPAHPASSLFVRATAAATADGRTVPAWVYWYARPAGHLPRVPSGDWLG